MPQFSFDPASAPASATKSFEPLPRGSYNAIIIDSDIKSTKAGTGEYIVIQVVDGINAGRRLWERLNVSNQNKTAEDIAKAALAELCSAVGVTKLTDTEQLHDRPFQVHVDIDRKDPTRNRVVGYGSSGLTPPPAAAAKATGTNSARPWAK
jgi:hypothetical protein